MTHTNEITFKYKGIAISWDFEGGIDKVFQDSQEIINTSPQSKQQKLKMSLEYLDLFAGAMRKHGVGDDMSKALSVIKQDKQYSKFSDSELTFGWCLHFIHILNLTKNPESIQLLKKEIKNGNIRDIVMG